MRISGHRTRSVFDRYNVTSEEDLRQAASRLEDYLLQQNVTLSVTPELQFKETSMDPEVQAIDLWRRGRDLNSRSPFEDSGFQDRHVRPLRHPSVGSSFS